MNQIFPPECSDLASDPSSWNIKTCRHKKGRLQEMIIKFQGKYSNVSCGNCANKMKLFLGESRIGEMEKKHFVSMLVEV